MVNQIAALAQAVLRLLRDSLLTKSPRSLRLSLNPSDPDMVNPYRTGPVLISRRSDFQFPAPSLENGLRQVPVYAGTVRSRRSSALEQTPDSSHPSVSGHRDRR